MRRKILMGVLALALPVGILGATTASAVASKAPPNPTSCTSLSGTLVFAGPETNEGQVTTSHTAGNTTVSSATFHCGPGAVSGAGGSGSTGTLTVKGGKNEKNTDADTNGATAYDKTSCKADPTDTAVCDKYVQDTWDEFAAAGSGLKKDLKSVSITIGGTSNTFKTASGSEFIGSPCGGSEVGFLLTGTVKPGTYETAKDGASLRVCLGADKRENGSTGTFGSDFGTDNGGGVVQASINSADSVGTL